MNPRAALHSVRDAAIRVAAERPFRPIENPAKRIVLVRPDHFGDMLMLSPVLNTLSGLVTGHEIVLMTGPWNHDVAVHVARANVVTTFEFPGFTRARSRAGILDPYRQIGEAAGTLRDMQPEAIVLLRDDHWWGAWMAREAGVPLRFGYAKRGLEPFLTHPVEIRHGHYVRQNLHLLSAALGSLGYANLPDSAEGLEMSWPVQPAAADVARSLRERHGIQDNYIVVHPGTGAPVKCWPVERWAATIDVLSDRTGLRVLLTGSPQEQRLCDAIAENTRTSPVNLAGTTTLFSLAEMLRGASLVLGVDSGPLHLATAVDTPSIHLFGPSDPARYGPWGDQSRHRVLSIGMSCPACGDISATRPEGCGCMLTITASMVIRAAMEMLDHGA